MKEYKNHSKILTTILCLGVKILMTKKELCEEIKYLKRKLIQIGDEKGIDHFLTIRTSQKLDKLINEYMKLTHRKYY